MTFLNIKIRTGDESRSYIMSDIMDIFGQTDYDIEELKWEDATTAIISPDAIAQSIRTQNNQRGI